MTAATEEQAAKPMLYDQDEPQVVKLDVPVEAERVEVEFNFKPFTDEQLFEFLAEKDDDASTSTRAFFKALLTDHNIDGDDGAKLSTDDVCELLDSQIKVAAIEKGLLASYFPPLPKAEGKRLRLSRGERYAVWPLAVIFNGQEIVTRHKLRQPTNEERQEYVKLFTLNRFIGRELCKLYTRLKHSVEGYVNDKVPANHKIAVIVQHFANHEEVLLGKSTPAPPQ